MTTDRKTPPPMYAVWNETHQFYELMTGTDRLLVSLRLSRKRVAFPSEQFRLITLVPQEESE